MLCVRTPEIWSGPHDINAPGWQVAVVRQGVRENWTVGQLRRDSAVERNRGLVDAIREKERLEYSSLESRKEDPIAAAHDGLIGHRVREAETRSEVLHWRVNGSGLLRIIRVGCRGLGQLGVIVAHAVVERQLWGGAELILHEEREVTCGEIQNRIAERLREIRPALRCGRVVRKILSKSRPRGVRIRTELAPADVQVILCVREVKSELHGVASLNPAQVIGKLKALLTGVQSRIVSGNAQVCLTRHGQFKTSGFRRNQCRIDGIVKPVFEPPKSKFVDQRIRRN